jgi:hypothetical protein
LPAFGDAYAYTIDVAASSTRNIMKSSPLTLPLHRSFIIILLKDEFLLDSIDVVNSGTISK